MFRGRRRLGRGSKLQTAFWPDCRRTSELPSRSSRAPSGGERTVATTDVPEEFLLIMAMFTSPDGGDEPEGGEPPQDEVTVTGKRDRRVDDETQPPPPTGGDPGTGVPAGPGGGGEGAEPEEPGCVEAAPSSAALRDINNAAESAAAAMKAQAGWHAHEYSAIVFVSNGVIGVTSPYTDRRADDVNWLGALGEVPNGATALLFTPVVRSREPRIPNEWVQVVSFHCGDTMLRISGYGASRPLDLPVTITINGRPVLGEAIVRLQSDLANRRAAYRITGLCPQGNDQISLIVSVGEMSRGGEVVYRSGYVNFVAGTLVDYNGLPPASARSFWFR